MDLIPGWEDSLEEGMQPTTVFMPGEFHRQKSLVGYSPQTRKESDTTEVTQHAHTHLAPVVFQKSDSFTFMHDLLPLHPLLQDLLEFLLSFFKITLRF